MKIRLYNDKFSFEEILSQDYIKEYFIWNVPEFNCPIEEITNDHPFAYGYLESRADMLHSVNFETEFTHIQFIKRPNIKNALWTILESSCLEEGGDGDSVFIAEKWFDAANEFESWCKENKNDWWERTDYDDHISFNHDQEGIYFAANSQICPWACNVLRYEWIPNHKS